MQVGVLVIGWDYHRGWKKVRILQGHPAADGSIQKYDWTACPQDMDKKVKEEAHRKEIDRSFREEHEVRV